MRAIYVNVRYMLIQEARTISLVSPFTACIVYDYVSIYQE